MHETITAYLATLVQRHKSPHTLRAARQDLTRFAIWWERPDWLTHLTSEDDLPLTLG